MQRGQCVSLQRRNNQVKLKYVLFWIRKYSVIPDEAKKVETNIAFSCREETIENDMFFCKTKISFNECSDKNTQVKALKTYVQSRNSIT